MKSRGVYVGTLRLEEPWYARSMKQGNFPARGSGEYWYDYKGFYFVGSGTNRGLVIPSESIIKVEVGFLHGIAFSWTKILKIVWRSGRERLSSGFIVSQADQVKQALTTTGWA
jgi:hypothetical protein